MGLKQEEVQAKSLGGNDTSNEMGHGVAHFLSGLFRFLCKVLFRYEVRNVEILRSFQGKDHGAVIVSPHVSYLDPIIMFVSARPKQWIRFVGKEDLFDELGGLLGWFVSRVGAIPVKRNSADLTMVKSATRMLKNGELVGIFPEGTRRGKGNVPCELHGGPALLARMGKAPLIPLGLTNCDKVKQKGKFFRFPKITATYGEPISLSSFDFLPKEERLDGCAWYVMRESFALTRNCKAEEVDMVSLFPESKDYTQIFAENPIPRVDVSTLPTYAEVQEKKKQKELQKKVKAHEES